MEFLHRFTDGEETWDVPHSELEKFRKVAGPTAMEVEFYRSGADEFEVPAAEREAFQAALGSGAAKRVYRYRNGAEEFAVPEDEVSPFWTAHKGQTGVGSGGGISWDGDMPMGIKVLDALARTASGMANGAWGGVSGLARVAGAGSDLVRRGFGETEEEIKADPGVAGRMANAIDEALGTTTREIGGEVAERSVVDNPEVLADPRWWYNGIGNAAGSMALMVAPGGVLGLSGKAATMTAAGVGGAMAGGQSYGSQKEQDGSTLASAARATALGFAIAGLERVGFDKIFGEGGANRALNVVKTMLAEGGEEYAENPVSALIENLGLVGPTEYGARVLEALKSGVNDAIFGGVLGGGIAVLKPAGRKGGTEGQDEAQAGTSKPVQAQAGTARPVQAQAGTSGQVQAQAGTSGKAGGEAGRGEAGLARTVADLDAALAAEAAGPVVQPGVQPPPLPVVPTVAQVGTEGQEQAQAGAVQPDAAQTGAVGQDAAQAGTVQQEPAQGGTAGQQAAQAGAVQPDTAQAGAVGQEQAQATPEIAKAFAAEQPAGKGKKAKGKKAQAGTTRQEQAQAGAGQPEPAQAGAVGQEQAQSARGKGRKVAAKVAPAEPTYVVGYQYTPKQIAKLSFAKMREAAKKNKYKDGSSVWDRVPGKNKLKDDVRAELLRHRKMYMEAEGKQEKKEWTPEQRAKASMAASARMYQRPDKYYDAMEEDLDALVKGEAEKGNLLEAGVRVMRTDSGEADDTVWTVLDMVFPSEIELSRGELRYRIESEGGKLETVWRRDIEPVEVEDGNSGGAGEGVFEGEPFVDEGAGGDVGLGSVEAGAAQGTGRTPEKPGVAPGGQVQLFGQDEGGFALVGGEVIDGERVNRERAEREAAAAAREAAQGKLGLEELIDEQGVPRDKIDQAREQGEQLVFALSAAARGRGESGQAAGMGEAFTVAVEANPDEDLTPRPPKGARPEQVAAWINQEWGAAFDMIAGTAKRISNVIEQLVRRDVKHVNLSGYRVDSAQDAAALLQAIHAPDLLETMRALYLDENGVVIEGRVISLGVLDATLAQPREILGNMPEGTAQVVIGHNHPSGTSKPSDADLSVTRTLRDAAAAVGVVLVDHVIINGKYHSMRDSGVVSFVEKPDVDRRYGRKAPTYREERAWEMVDKRDFLMRPTFRGSLDVTLFIDKMMRKGAKSGTYALAVNSQNQLIAVYQFADDAKAQEVMETIGRDSGRHGIAAVILARPEDGNTESFMAFGRDAVRRGSLLQVHVLEVMRRRDANAEGPEWYSGRENGIFNFSMYEARAQYGEPGAVREERAEFEPRMHGTAARVAAAPLGDSVLGRPGSYYAPVSFEEAAEQARQLSTQDLMSQAERLATEQKKFESDMGVIAGAEAFNRLHAAVVQAVKSGDAEARARAVAERDAWLDTMNKLGMTAARLLGQFRYLKAGMPGAQIAIVERELREKGLTLREEDRRALEGAIVEDTQAQRALAGAQAAQARNPSAAGAAAVTAAQGQAVMALRKLWKAQRVLPRDLADEIVFAMQMNVMTPVSSLGNILGNIMFLGPELAAREHAAVIDRFVSFLGGKARTVRGVSAREIKEVGRTLAGSGPALGSILARGDTGRIQNMAGQRGEWRPLIAWTDMMAGRMVRVMKANGQAGRVPVSEFLSRALEGTSGMAAAPMARTLKVGDYLFSRPAEAAALVEIGELQGLQGAALEAFLQNPPADAVKAAKEQGLWTTFQKGGGPAAGVSFALNNLKKKGLHGKVAYVGARAVMPFVKTPLNILGRVLRYTPTIGMWSVFEAAREGNVREVRLGLARQLVGAEVLTAVGLMAMLGVLFGTPDDEKKRAVAQATTGTGKANISGLRRAMARMAAGNWTLDDLREAAEWRTDDEMMGFNYMGIPGLFASMAANTQLAVEAGRNSDDPWKRDRGALASWLVEAGLNVPNAMIELSMMKGAYTALDAFAKKQPKRFVANMVSTLASVALPRTLETEQDAAWTWAPETKGKTIGEEVSAALAQRIPGRMYGELPVKRDYFGRPVRNVPEGVNPWLAKNFDVLQGGKVRGNDVDRELADIYNATGDAEAWPSIPERVYIRKDGTEVVMTPAEWSKHLRNVGAARYGLVQEAMRMQTWGKMRPDEKLAVLGRIYGTGRKIGTFMSDQQRDTGSIPWSQIPKSIQQAWQVAATD